MSDPIKTPHCDGKQLFGMQFRPRQMSLWVRYRLTEETLIASKQLQSIHHQIKIYKREKRELKSGLRTHDPRITIELACDVDH